MLVLCSAFCTIGRRTYAPSPSSSHYGDRSQEQWKYMFYRKYLSKLFIVVCLVTMQVQVEQAEGFCCNNHYNNGNNRDNKNNHYAKIQCVNVALSWPLLDLRNSPGMLEPGRTTAMLFESESSLDWSCAACFRTTFLQLVGAGELRCAPAGGQHNIYKLMGQAGDVAGSEWLGGLGVSEEQQAAGQTALHRLFTVLHTRLAGLPALNIQLPATHHCHTYIFCVGRMFI